jgi:uncharacterized protein
LTGTAGTRTTYLLDVNVLIALVDGAHVHHDAAHRWFERDGAHAWATCPITENALLRIVGHPRYPKSPGTPETIAEVLIGLRALPGHRFWPDDLSIVEAPVDRTRLLLASQVTDTYLLALARAHDGQLATFDRNLVTDAVVGGAAALCRIPP